MRRQIDPLYKLTTSIRASIRHSLKNKGYTKKSRTYQILGCSFEDFKQHIEKQFEPWMNWANHGLYNGEFDYGWDYDHKIVISSAKTEEDIIRLNHYTNFQPLCTYKNRVLKRNNSDYIHKSLEK